MSHCDGIKGVKILFDATILAEGLHKTSNRSGIFWAALGIFGALDRRDDVELGIYSSPSFVDSVNEFLAREFPGRGYKVLNREHSCFLGPIREKIESLRERPKNKRGLRKKALVLCGMLVKIARILWDKYVGCRRTARIADGFDAFFSPVYLAPRPIRRYSRTRRFTLLHDTIPMIYPQFSPFTALGFSWNFDLIKHLDENDFCFANSECTRRDFLRFCKGLRPENVTVLPLAADSKFYPEHGPARLSAVRAKYGIPAGVRYALSLCTIEPRKNFERSLEAFCRAVESVGDDKAVFVIAGGKWGRYESKWNAILSRFSGSADRILPVGYVDDEDLAAIYSGATLFLYPSLYEGFGLPPLEAMQCGVPVVTSNTSSLPEVVGDAALLVDPTSVDEIALAIERLLSDNLLHDALLLKGLKRASLFSWNHTAEVVVCRISDVIKG